MTAEDARDLTRQAVSDDGAMVRLALDLWLDAIRAAGKNKRRSVRSNELRVLRTPISTAARNAALDVLRSKQFVVEVVHEIRSGTVIEVSW